jgi:hypothetical protein
MMQLFTQAARPYRRPTFRDERRPRCRAGVVDCLLFLSALPPSERTIREDWRRLKQHFGVSEWGSTKICPRWVAPSKRRRRHCIDLDGVRDRDHEAANVPAGA